MPEVTETVPAQQTKVFEVNENEDGTFNLWITGLSENLSRGTLEQIHDAIGESLGRNGTVSDSGEE